MAVKLRCECGKLLSASDELVGKRVKCPACGRTFIVYPEGGGVEQPLQMQRAEQTEVTCVRCGHSVRPGLAICPQCGGNPVTGAAPPKKSTLPVQREEDEMGFLRLCLGMLIHPVRTSDELVGRLSYTDMLVKTAVFFVSGALALALVAAFALGEEGPGLSALPLTVLQQIIGLALSALFVALVGKMVSGQWLYLATLVGFAFMTGLVNWVLIIFVALGLSGILSATAIMLIIFVGFLWILVLQLLVVRGIFGYGLGAAFLIMVLAGLLQSVTEIVISAIFQG